MKITLGYLAACGGIAARTFGVLLLCSAAAYAQAPPVHIGVASQTVDEFGHLLEGTAPGVSSFGLTPVAGDLIQILDATAGIRPPHINGQPHFLNPIIATSHIGDGVAATDPRSGRFSKSLASRPSGPIFVRVFNAPTADAASFYTDSQLFSAVGGERLIADITATDQPLDPSDSDGDGLHNSWEESYGSDDTSSDSDSDGINDLDEHLAGTDLTDGDAYLSICTIDVSNQDLLITWCSTATKSYQLEFADAPLGQHPFVPIGNVVTATTSTTAITLPAGINPDAGCFRITLVQP